MSSACAPPQALPPGPSAMRHWARSWPSSRCDYGCFSGSFQIRAKPRFLFCARGGLRLKLVFERFLARSGLHTEIASENLMVSRLVAARAAVAKPGDALLSELGREFEDRPMSDVAAALAQRSDLDLGGEWHERFQPDRFVTLLTGQSAGAAAFRDEIAQQNDRFRAHLAARTQGRPDIILCDTGLFGSTVRLLREGMPDRRWYCLQFARSNYKRLATPHFDCTRGLCVESDFYRPWQVETFSPALLATDRGHPGTPLAERATVRGGSAKRGAEEQPGDRRMGAARRSHRGLALRRSALLYRSARSGRAAAGRASSQIGLATLQARGDLARRSGHRGLESGGPFARFRSPRAEGTVRPRGQHKMGGRQDSREVFGAKAQSCSSSRGSAGSVWLRSNLHIPLGPSKASHPSRCGGAGDVGFPLGSPANKRGSIHENPASGEPLPRGRQWHHECRRRYCLPPDGSRAYGRLRQRRRILRRSVGAIRASGISIYRKIGARPGRCRDPCWDILASCGNAVPTSSTPI